MSTPLPMPTLIRHRTTRAVATRLAAFGAAWLAAYVVNDHLWGAIFDRWLHSDPNAPAVGAARFFLADSAKLLLLLVGMVFVIGMVRTTINPERVRTALEGKRLITALVLAAVFGAITPFCSCSSVPLFIGFVAAGIPLSVTLTFLIASPLVNEVAVVVLGTTFGWGITAAYVGAGLILAIGAGLALSRFDLRPHVKEFVFTRRGSTLHLGSRRPTLEGRAALAWSETKDILRRVWVWVLVGVAIGAAIHGWVPADFFLDYAGPDDPLAVPIATLAGVPLYSNAAGVIPIAQALWAKGMALGTVMSFMMATVALSLPEFMLLRAVLKPRLLAAFFGIVTVGIMAIGFLFNWAS